MDSSTLLILTVFLTIMLFILQRTDRSRRFLVLAVLAVPALILRQYVIARGIESTAWAAFFIAALLNFIFWVLVGRYNVGTSDNIRVLGMDD